MIIHVEWSSWTINKSFRRQVDRQDSTDYAKGGIDLCSAIENRFERFRLIETRRTPGDQDYTIVVAAADVQLDLQLTRHPSETDCHLIDCRKYDQCMAIRLQAITHIRLSLPEIKENLAKWNSIVESRLNIHLMPFIDTCFLYKIQENSLSICLY